MINPVVTSEIKAPAPVKAILINACYDCHSNETKYSWFDKITPANWLVEKHIREGRNAVNFSEWGNLSKDQQSAILFESLNLMQYHVMPLQQYSWLHPASNIGRTQIDTLMGYLKTLFIVQTADTAKGRLWDIQYARWIGEDISSRQVKLSPNGIAFMPDYKNWVAISSTERSDKGTLRIIAGNKITIDAIRENQINPWPDGSAFAKIIWTQVLDSAGVIHGGEFQQVDFMVKGKEKFAETGGWGYARWYKGIQLVAYGKNPLFATECVNCHRSMKNNDFIFTKPININANPAQQERVLNLYVNAKDKTISTLYGNDTSSVSTLITWNQADDEHWFGAHIPGKIKSIKKILPGGARNLILP